MLFNLKAKKTLHILLTIIGILTILNCVAIALKITIDNPKLNDYVLRLVDFDKEANLPSLFSAWALIGAGVLLAYTAQLHKRLEYDYPYWMGLSFLFVCLGIDEAIMIHEIVSGPVRKIFDVDGALYLAWVIPYAILALGVGILYSRFLLRQVSIIRNLFLLSGFIFVTGAIGFELLGSSFHAEDQTYHPLYSMLYTVEELLEMVGTSIFIYALQKNIEENYSQTKLLMVFNQDKQQVGR